MVPLNELTAETILSQKLIAEVFDQEDELYRAELFLSWAAKKRIVQTDNRGNPTKQKKIDGRNNRCVCLKVDQDMDTDGFMKVEDTGMRQEELPFR